VFARIVLLNCKPLLQQAAGELPTVAPKIVVGNELILVQLSYCVLLCPASLAQCNRQNAF
jgi:hypothetical protein